MTREEAILRIKDHIEIHKYHEAIHAFKIFEALNMAIKALELEPQWIPCSNTVDIPDYEVLCCDKRGNELVGWLFYNNNQWICESEGEIMYGTIAWMPPPEPYQGGQEE